MSASSDIFVDFCGALQSNRYVRKLEIEDATLDDAMIDMLMDALISRSIDLYSLELTSLQFGDAGAQSVSEFLDKTSALRNLKLARNSIGDAGASAIASHMPASLHELDLSNNKVSDTGLINLITAAQDGALVRLIVHSLFFQSSHQSFSCERLNLTTTLSRMLALAKSHKC